MAPSAGVQNHKHKELLSIESTEFWHTCESSCWAEAEIKSIAFYFSAGELMEYISLEILV